MNEDVSIQQRTDVYGTESAGPPMGQQIQPNITLSDLWRSSFGVHVGGTELRLGLGAGVAIGLLAGYMVFKR